MWMIRKLSVLGWKRNGRFPWLKRGCELMEGWSDKEKNASCEKRGVMEHTAFLESGSAAELLKCPFDRDVSRMWEERESEGRESWGERWHNSQKKKSSSFGTRLSDLFRELVSMCVCVCACLCVWVCVLTPFHVLSLTHHSLWVCVVLLSPWIWRTAHQWAALIWWGRGLVGRRGQREEGVGVWCHRQRDGG